MLIPCSIFRFIRSFIFFVPILCSFQITMAQSAIKGKVQYRNDQAPAARVNIQLLRDTGNRTYSDDSGNFYLKISESQKNDTLIISSVGYKSIRMPVNVAVTKTVFTLSAVVKSMETVTLFTSNSTIGSKLEKVGYYRSWSHENTGAEIGRIFNVPYDKFRIDKIRFKAGNTCDSCLLQLHIRYIEDGMPADEMFDRDILLRVNNLSIDSKVPEFDLEPFNLTFTENEFYIGIEVLNCDNSNENTCAFSFAGTEKGEYLFKAGEESPWQTEANDYTIYLKLFLRF